MSEKLDPQLRLRIALRDLAPEDDPDDFAELVEAMLAKELDQFARASLQTLIAQQFGLAPFEIRAWAAGASMPTPKLRRRVVTYIRGRAAELGIQES